MKWRLRLLHQLHGASRKQWMDGQFGEILHCVWRDLANLDLKHTVSNFLIQEFASRKKVPFEVVSDGTAEAESGKMGETRMNVTQERARAHVH